MILLSVLIDIVDVNRRMQITLSPMILPATPGHSRVSQAVCRIAGAVISCQHRLQLAQLLTTGAFELKTETYALGF